MTAGRDGPIRGLQSLVSGIVLILLAVLALWLTRDLNQGTLRAMGPAMLPRWLAIGVALCGIALIVAAFLQTGQALEAYTLRGPTMVVIGVLAFGLTIRGLDIGPVTVPSLGMIVAGPLAMFVAGYATPEAQPRELLTLSFALTAACMLLFGDLLNLPIPLYPQALSDLYPAGWSNDARLRATAGALVLAAAAVYLTVPRRREPRPLPPEHAGVEAPPPLPREYPRVV